MRIGAMFMTLYFTPLSNFIMSIFGLRHSGEAIAGRITCTGTRGTATMDCIDNNISGEISALRTITCQCEGKPGVYFDVQCTMIDRGLDEKSNPITAGEWTTVRGTCNPKCTSGQTQSCTSGGGTGTQGCTQYGEWGTCNITGCANGYIKIDNKCYASCNIDNGSGYKRNIYEETSSSSSTEA